jgi:hypothetical protein
VPRTRVEVTDEFLAERNHTRESYEKLSRTGRWYIRNQDKAKTYRSVHDTPLKSRERWLRNKYDMTASDYERMYEEQDGQCAICSASYDVLCVDHCHVSGKVRGLLCSPCNTGLGHMADTPERLRAAANYLEKQQ